MSLMVSISGIRGIVGSTLTPDAICKYTSAFANLSQNGLILVGRDSRKTGEMVENLVVGTLLACGCRVIRLGIVSTPSCEVMVQHLKADGGIVITASHNPPQWNALKFLGSDGMFLRQDSVADMQKALESPFRAAEWSRIMPVEMDTSATKIHLDRIYAIPYLNLEAIRKRKFKVVVDTNHGAAGPSAAELLYEFGCDVFALGKEPNGEFAHGCEPVPANLGLLANAVEERNADIGFAVDPDGDRLALVSDEGVAIGEEYTLAVTTQCVLARKKGPVTLNLSTSRMAEAIAEGFGCQTYRTPVGEIHVSSAMLQNGSVFGGEGNGGAMLPEVLYGRDSHVGMALTLQALLEAKKPLSGLIQELPEYHMIKGRVELEGLDPDKALQQIEKQMPEGKTNRDDGLRIEWPDAWIHIRKSNTEPIVRTVIEAKTEEQALALETKIRQLIEN